jgi:hypothetical protein
MPTWNELEIRFSQLAQEMLGARVDGFWRSNEEVWRVAGYSDSNAKKRFEAIALMAGKKLSEVLEAGNDINDEILAENDPIVRWYKGIWKISGNFKRFPTAREEDKNGNVVGYIYGGNILNIVDASATFCLELAAQYPEEHPEEREPPESSPQDSRFKRLTDKYAIPIVKTIIGGLIVGIILIFIRPWFIEKPNINVKVSLLAYERAFTITDKEKIYYWEMRNLATNCSLWRHSVPLPRNRAETPKPEARMFIKILLENLTSTQISNLRLVVRVPQIQSLTLSCTPNVEATIEEQSSYNEMNRVNILKVSSLAPKTDAILTLEKKLAPELYNKRINISFPLMTSDQFSKPNPEVIHFNALEMVQRENEIITGERTFGNEKLEFRLLRPDEPDISDDQVSYKRMSPAKKCPEGTGGNW